jgi:HSP20 family protein
MYTYNFFDDVTDLRNVVDAFFGEVPARRREFPYVRLIESGDVLEVRALLPGLTAADVNIELVDTSLLIEGEKKSDYVNHHYIRRERSFGHFKKSIKLPYRVDAGNIRAELVNGILTVHLAKSEEAKPKRIEIK